MILKWSKSEILNLQKDVISFDEELTFPKAVFEKNHHLRDLKNVNVKGKIYYNLQSDLVTCELVIDADMILSCAITNEDVVYPFETETTELFAFRKVEDYEDVHEAKGDIVELLPTIFQTIMMEIPLKVVKDGVKEYPKGDGWEVIKESDYQSRKKDEVDPRLAKLKEFKIDED